MICIPRRGQAAMQAAAWGAAWVLGSTVPVITAPREAAAQAPSPITAPAVGPMSWYNAILRTQSTGTPTVLVVTSERVPSSKELMRSLAASPLLARLRDQVMLAELSAEAEPAQFQNLQVGCPAFVAFRRGASGMLERAAAYPAAIGPEGLVGWLVGLKLISPPMDARTAVQASAPAPSQALAPVPAPARNLAVDAAVVPTSLGSHFAPQPSPQQPAPPPVMYAPPVTYAAPQAYAPPREVVVERAAPRRVVREVAPRQREVVVERVIEREVESQPAPRNILTRPREVVVEREAAPREIVREVEAAPREVVREVEAAPREVVVEREVEAAPRRVVQVAAAPRELAVETSRDAEAPLTIVQPGLLDRFVGALGARMAQRGRARAYLDVETQKVYRAAAPVAPAARCIMPAPAPCAAPPVSAPPPPYYAPSPQSMLPQAPPGPTPQYSAGG